MKKLYVVPLPPDVVALLESKHRGDLELERSEQWQAVKGHLTASLERMHRWASHQGLDPVVQKAQEHLSEFEMKLGPAGSLEDATKSGFQLFGALNEYARLRQTLCVCQISEIDEVVQGLHALGRGRLDWAGLEGAKNRLIARVDRLVQLFQDGREHLPEPIQQSLLKGFDSMNAAVSQINAQNQSSIATAAADLVNAGKILEHLDKWKQEFEAESTCQVPVIGREVQELMTELQANGQLKPSSVDKWYNELAPRVQEFWGPTRHEFFMPRPLKDKLVGRIDSLLYELQELENMTPQEQFDTLRNLSDAFAEIPTRSYQKEWFEHHPHPWLFDTFVAVLAKGVPSFQLTWLIEDLSASADTYELAQCLREYVSTDDRDYILDALDIMQRESQRNA